MQQLQASNRTFTILHDLTLIQIVAQFMRVCSFFFLLPHFLFVYISSVLFSLPGLIVAVLVGTSNLSVVSGHFLFWDPLKFSNGLFFFSTCNIFCCLLVPGNPPIYSQLLDENGWCPQVVIDFFLRLESEVPLLPLRGGGVERWCAVDPRRSLWEQSGAPLTCFFFFSFLSFSRVNEGKDLSRSAWSEM